MPLTCKSTVYGKVFLTTCFTDVLDVLSYETGFLITQINQTKMLYLVK